MRDYRSDPAALSAAAAQMGVGLDSAQAEALLQFHDLLLRWNRAFNLVSRRDTDRLLTRHLLDSLSLVPWVQGTVMDLGTGAGLPGVPLAIAQPRQSFTLVDRNERKIRFLRQVARELGLDNIHPWCGDVRGLPADARFDTVACRAVAAIAEVWALAGSRLAPGGCLLIMHRGQSRAAVDGVPDVLPRGRLRERRMISVPGLPRPHELVVFERDTG